MSTGRVQLEQCVDRHQSKHEQTEMLHIPTCKAVLEQHFVIFCYLSSEETCNNLRNSFDEIKNYQ